MEKIEKLTFETPWAKVSINYIRKYLSIYTLKNIIIKFGIFSFEATKGEGDGNVQHTCRDKLNLKHRSELMTF